MATATTPLGTFQTVQLTYHAADHVLHVEFNRPDKLNAMTKQFWRELRTCFVNLATHTLSADAAADAWDVRAVVVSGGAASKAFSAGLDLVEFASGFFEGGDDIARGAMRFLAGVDLAQDTFTAMERCPQPVIAAVHGACIGAGVDLIAACDIRLCSSDALFSVKEVDVGLAADLGTLQRLPRVVGNHSWIREVSYTGRTFGAAEARAVGLVSGAAESVGAGHAAVVEEAMRLARMIAAKSPVAVAGTKNVLIHARDHSVAEGLKYVGLWNASMLRSGDLAMAMQASLAKKRPKFAKL
ncbi:ClpP/crotonase-like domain-containing protein [Zopfochytrium polystomum]|nr:ClpP/crotonase-like domain-containing protein [Zopfochytrium polystomum]